MRGGDAAARLPSRQDSRSGSASSRRAVFPIATRGFDVSIRLNKLLAERGVGARRKCDTIIASGRVQVNGEVVREPGTPVEESRDRVTVDGKPLPRRAALRYFVLNKPVGVITTLDDPQGRRTVREFLPGGQRMFPVGRLDADTSGLLLLTNDGELAHRLMHPRYGVEKVYRVRLDREPSEGQLARLARGVAYEPGVTSAPARLRRVKTEFEAIMVEIAVHEGRYRQVRRMFEAVGLDVKGLHRVAYGPVRLGPLARGLYRELSEDEVARLRSASARPHARPSGLARGAQAKRAAGRPRPLRDDAGERRGLPARPMGRGSRDDAGARGGPPARPSGRRSMPAERDLFPPMRGSRDAFEFDEGDAPEDFVPRERRSAEDFGAEPEAPRGRRDSGARRPERRDAPAGRAPRTGRGPREDRAPRGGGPRDGTGRSRPAISRGGTDWPARAGGGSGDADWRGGPSRPERGGRGTPSREPRRTALGRDDRAPRDERRGERTPRAGRRDDRGPSGARSGGFRRDDRAPRGERRGDGRAAGYRSDERRTGDVRGGAFRRDDRRPGGTRTAPAGGGRPRRDEFGPGAGRASRGAGFGSRRDEARPRGRAGESTRERGGRPTRAGSVGRGGRPDRAPRGGPPRGRSSRRPR